MVEIEVVNYRGDSRTLQAGGPGGAGPGPGGASPGPGGAGPGPGGAGPGASEENIEHIYLIDARNLQAGPGQPGPPESEQYEDDTYTYGATSNGHKVSYSPHHHVHVSKHPTKSTYTSLAENQLKSAIPADVKLPPAVTTKISPVEEPGLPEPPIAVPPMPKPPAA